MRRVLLILAFFIAACSDDSLLAIEKGKELVILTRPGNTTYTREAINGAYGFDYDLARLFAKELGVKVRFVVAGSDADLLQRLQKNEAHLAAAWQTPVSDPAIRASLPYFQNQDVLVTHEATLPVTRIEQLANKTVQVIAGSQQEKLMLRLKEQLPGLNVVATTKRSELDLLEGVAGQRYEAAVVSHPLFDIGSNYYPELQKALDVGPSRPIVWLFAPNAEPQLLTQANDFLTRIQKNGELDRLQDRYFAHVTRLTQLESAYFIERMREVLPRYKALFQDAQLNTGIDWRLLAALAYQESKWDPLATSPTGVRGMMMLTGDTADTLGVTNRLDPAQSIAAGAQYLNDLRRALPGKINEPDRLWLALAAYNLGFGHLKAARNIATSLKTNPDSWYEMKKVLPLLAQPAYYKKLKSGKGRGGEAVILVENIRIYADILNRLEQPFDPLDIAAKNATKQRQYSMSANR